MPAVYYSIPERKFTARRNPSSHCSRCRCWCHHPGKWCMHSRRSSRHPESFHYKKYRYTHDWVYLYEISMLTYILDDIPVDRCILLDVEFRYRILNRWRYLLWWMMHTSAILVYWNHLSLVDEWNGVIHLELNRFRN